MTGTPDVADRSRAVRVLLVITFLAALISLAGLLAPGLGAAAPADTESVPATATEPGTAEPTPTSSPTTPTSSSTTPATATPTPTPSASGSPEASPTATSATTSAADTSTATSTSTSAEPTTTAPRTAPTTQLPAVPPAAQRSEVGLGTVAVALGVLVAAAAVVGVVAYRHRRSRPPTRRAPPAAGTGTVGVADDGPPAEPSRKRVDRFHLDDVMELLVDLGDAMVRSGAPVTHVQASLVRIAEVNGVRDAEIVVLPTALIITAPGAGETRTEVATSGGAGLRLDQVDAVFRTATAAERGEIGVRDAIAAVHAADAMPPSFGAASVIAGHAVIAVGLAVVLAGGWTSFPVAAALGAAVGLIKWVAARQPATVQVFVPVTCAFAVSAATALLTRTDLDPGLLPPIIGALVTFIPGGVLTTAVLELATGQMISGASRLMFGGLQLVLLAIGIVGGVQLVGLPVIEIAPGDDAGALSPWIGVLVFGLGVLLSFSGRPASFGWMLLVLYVAFAGQLVGGLLLGNYLSGFVGAAVMTPVAVFAAGQKSGPPTLVTFLPAFWLLVPGAVALIGVTQVVGETQAGGLTSILTAGVTFVAIALGVVLGSAVSRGDEVTTRPLSTASSARRPPGAPSDRLDR